MKLTQRIIETLKCPPTARDALVFDDEQRGLGVRVTASAGQNLPRAIHPRGAKATGPSGSCSAISLATARAAVQDILGKVATGRDPAAERKAAALEAVRKAAHEALTLEALLEQWKALHLADRRDRYRAEAIRAIKSAFLDRLMCRRPI